MKTSHCEQLSDEWFEARKFRLTGSNAQAIGNGAKGLDTYVLDMMAESYSNGERDNYTNEHLQRGLELESQAREMYSLETGNSVEQVGFVEYNDYVLASPDGLIGNDGLLEVKCHADRKHFRLILNGEKEIDSGYIWQVQMGLLVTGRKYADLLCYNPNFQKSLLIFKILPDEGMQTKLLEGFKIGEEKIKLIKRQLQ